MQIREAKIFNFGKLQNVQFDFSEGINVIYGGNERGKTTLHTFLTSMLFGMEKSRGRAGKEDVYSRYEPWHAPSFYSGALRFMSGKQPFYLERNFYSKEKSDYLRNEADGEELSVAYGDLEMLLGGIGREEFANTYDVPQSGAMTGKAMTELLTEYLAEAEAGGNGKIHVLEAEKKLNVCKKECLVRQKQMEEERHRTIGQKRIESDVLKEDIIKLQQQIQAFGAEQRKLAKKAMQKERKRQLIWQRGMTAAIVLGILFTGILLGGIFNESKVLFFGLAAGTGVVLLGILAVLFQLREKEGDETLIHAESMLLKMQEHLQENENTLINLEEELEELQKLSQQEQELLLNIEALELAKSQLKELSEDYYLEVADELNAEISKWVSRLTIGIYDSVRLGKDGKLWILAEGKEVAPEALSRGTLEQIYLALRLAVGTVLLQEEEMPIFLDETFAMYDDLRLKETLRVLSGTGKQVFIFTCQKREMMILKEEEIPYHLICM